METNNKNDVLKAIGAISMIIDHIGAVFLPHMIILRAIGRLAFPIFAYQVALGFEKTRNPYKYILRMLSFAVLSAYPFYSFSMIVSQDPGYQNVLFTFFFALLVLKNLKEKKWVAMIAFGVVPVLLLGFVGITFDYGLYGIACVVVFYLAKSHLQRSMGIFSVTVLYLSSRYISAGISIVQVFSNLQLLSVLSVYLIDRKFETNVRLPRYFFYLFYPLHMAMIVLVYSVML
ncbi:TraX family protein [Alkalibacter saccharofermentans]|uniref:TraX protein n=1 Tax=Alkalibacter saccharofermentans DSM 14828 TaxID=1120975 RepID=A0A1M4XFD1_9FIRM|nr:TraX family protein [Alkalibacter saccharofermentans]SHE92111.1 TraX protein [Alkalibacter saccharofermentans DSM 14828]